MQYPKCLHKSLCGVAAQAPPNCLSVGKRLTSARTHLEAWHAVLRQFSFAHPEVTTVGVVAAQREGINKTPTTESCFGTRDNYLVSVGHSAAQREAYSNERSWFGFSKRGDQPSTPCSSEGEPPPRPRESLRSPAPGELTEHGRTLELAACPAGVQHSFRQVVQAEK